MLSIFKINRKPVVTLNTEEKCLIIAIYIYLMLLELVILNPIGDIFKSLKGFFA